MNRLMSFPLWGTGRPLLLDLRSSRRFFLTVVCVGVFVDIFVYGIVIPILPFSLLNRLHVAEENVQRWISTLMATYGAAFMVTSLVCGMGCEFLPSKRVPLLLGAILLGGATTVVCLGTSLPVLVVGRLLQGSATALTWVVGQALLVENMGEGAAGRAAGYVTAAYSSSMLMAPLLGGVIYRQLGYIVVYSLTFALILGDMVLRLLLVEESEKSRWLGHGVSLGVEDNSLEKKLTSDRQSSRTDSAMDAQPPCSPWNQLCVLLRSVRMWAAFGGLLVISAELTALDTTMSLFVKETFHWNSLDAGLVFLAPLTPLALGGPGVGILIDKLGARWMATAGLASSIPWWALLGRINHDSLSQKSAFCVLLMLIGFSTLLAMTALMAEFGRVAGGVYSQSFGFSTLAMAGGVTLAIWSGAVRESYGWFTMAWSFAVASGAVTFPVMLFTDGWLGEVNLRRRPRGDNSSSLRV